MANDVAVPEKKTFLVEVEKKLVTVLKDQTDAFPKGFNQTRHLQNCLAVLSDTKEIEKCKPMTVVRTIVKGAYLGLDFFRKECYAIPYGNDLTFQTSYVGEIKLAKMYCHGIKDIYAKVVQEGDDLDIKIENGSQIINFKPRPFNNAPIIGAFAVALFENGTTRYETMSKEDIEDVRKKYSKAQNSPAWMKSWGEMAKKTVLRRLCKLLDLDFDNIEQSKAYDEGGDADFHKPQAPQEPVKVVDPFKKEGPATGPEKAQDAVIVPSQDKKDKIREELRAKNPGLTEWDLDEAVDAEIAKGA